MSDLVKRLRTELFGGTFDTMREAADRIEVLELALREIKDQYLTPDQSSAIARKALAPEQDKP